MKSFITLSIILVNIILLLILGVFSYFKGTNLIGFPLNFVYQIIFLYIFLLLIFSFLLFLLIKKKKFLFIRYLLNLLYSSLMLLAKIFKISNKKIQKSYIKLNNIIISSSFQKPYQTKDLLILLPHCLQSSKCKIRITKDINNCIECGLCDICQMKKTARKNKLKIYVVMGGTLARQKVMEAKPKLILACACHRDLAEGIKDTFPFLVYGFCNKIISKSCEDTKIDFSKVNNLIEKLL